MARTGFYEIPGHTLGAGRRLSAGQFYFLGLGLVKPARASELTSSQSRKPYLGLDSAHQNQELGGRKPLTSIPVQKAEDSLT